MIHFRLRLANLIILISDAYMIILNITSFMMSIESIIQTME